MAAALTRREVIAGIAPAVAIGLMPCAARAAGNDPVAFARELYALPELWGDATKDDAAIDRYLAPDLAKLVRENYAKTDFESALDYDPLIQAQEAEDDLKPKFKLANRGASEATVKVAFDNFEEHTELALDLLMTGKGWRLADLHPSDGSSLILELTELNAASE